MIYLTGDTHAELSRFRSKEWPLGRTLTRNDYVIILGDFGLLWDRSSHDDYHLDWLNNKPWTTLWLDGNHENFDMIAELPQEPMFGGTVGKTHDNIFHLNRGQVYTIEGKKLFTLGGGLSIDKVYRKEGKSWWPGELLNSDDIKNAWDNLADAGFEVDYILTHTCPAKVLHCYSIDTSKLLDPVSMQLQDIYDSGLRFKHWYFGHLHFDRSVSTGMEDVKFTCLYKKIIELGEVL